MRILALVVIVMACSGCMEGVSRVRHAAERTQTRNDLKQLALAYEQFQSKNARPPKSLLLV